MKNITLPLIYSNTMFACLLPISSGTAGPIWLNFFCQLRLGHGMVLGQKNSGSGIRIFRKSGKTRILGCFLTNLAENFRYFTLTQTCFNTNRFLDWVSGFPDLEDFFKFFGRFFKIKVKIIKYRLHLNVWNLQIGKMIMETECVRFAKNAGFSTILEDFFKNGYKSH